MKTKFPVVSECIEPAMAHIIGRLYKQVEEATKTKENKTAQIERACLNLWLAAQSMNHLSITCNMSDPGAVHFSIAAGNEIAKISKYIKTLLGFSPYFDKDHPTAKIWNNTWT